MKPFGQNSICNPSEITYKVNKSVIAILDGLMFPVANPGIREVSPFCKGLGNKNKGIVLQWKGGRKQGEGQY